MSRSLFFVLTALFASSIAVSVPRAPSADLLFSTRAGPSGTLIQPAGGTDINNDGGLGYFTLEYEPVNEANVKTVSIDLVMYDPSGALSPKPVAYGVHVPPDGSNIIGYFTPTLCSGEFTLNVTEHQWIGVGINGYGISFQSAAPSISVGCGPVQ